MNPEFEEKQSLHLPQPSLGRPVSDDAQSAATQPAGSTGQDSDAYTVQAIEKAKSIAAQFKADPYQQSNQIARLKAEFLHNKYHKDIKLEERSK